MRGDEQTASPRGNCYSRRVNSGSGSELRSGEPLSSSSPPTTGMVCAVLLLQYLLRNERTRHTHGSGNRLTPAPASPPPTAGAAGAEAPPDVGDGIRSGDGAGAGGQSVPGRKPRRADTRAARRRLGRRCHRAAGAELGRADRPRAGRLGQPERRAADAVAAPARAAADPADE